MTRWFKDFSSHFRDRSFLISTAAGFTLLIISLGFNFVAGSYASHHESNTVTDIILSNIPVFDVDEVFIYGSFAFAAIVVFLCFHEPRVLPFTVKSIALFVFIRALFVSLTHLAPPVSFYMDSNIMSKLTFGGDLFFSGHTGLPFLMALIFWDTKYLRLFFIFISVFFGATVLMGHLHYSIDVFAAFFITYSIFHLAQYFFPKDRRLFREGLEI